MEWVEQLGLAGLPGRDYILTGFNSQLDSWLHRRANYGDIARALQAILVTVAGVPRELASALTPHSFRHFLVGPGRQLQIQGLVTVEGMESLGHWERGSTMPALYDAHSGVTELSTRSSIVGALAKGWSPAKNGEIAAKFVEEPVVESKAAGFTIAKMACKLRVQQPQRPLDQVEDASAVAHTKRKRIHMVNGDTGATVCGWWKCGTRGAPSRYADFCNPGPKLLEEYSWCAHCIK